MHAIADITPTSAPYAGSVLAQGLLPTLHENPQRKNQPPRKKSQIRKEDARQMPPKSSQETLQR